MIETDQQIVQRHVNCGEPIPAGTYLLTETVVIPAGQQADFTAACCVMVA